MTGEIHKEELAVVLDDDGGAEIDEKQREERASLLFLAEHPSHKSSGDNGANRYAPHTEVLVEGV